jgi:SAM-dependent methyltransferase
VWKPAPSTRVLHIAPERQLSLAIRKLLEGQHHQTEYLGLDKRSGLYRYPAWVQKGDITNLPFPPQHFDLLIANHVLEHIRDLDLALAEIKRVLKPGGLLIAQVPWAKELTISSLSPALPLLKRALWQRKHHGQWDHAWLFGQDLTRLMAKQNFSPQFWQPEADSQLFINALEPLMLYKS